MNYLFENRTVLWWGGIGNSVEHTAYFNLKRGIHAPDSGSEKINGPVMASQIGAQIFMDAYALMCPGDPDKAVWYAGECARVSHDGVAVNAAEFLAALESYAFIERDVEKILDHCSSYIKFGSLARLISEVREQCAKNDDWRTVRSWIAANHGYDRYKGSCPIETNHAVVVASMILGGDDFRKSLMIATSAGWDTDCNAANVGCFNGVRLGLDGINKACDLRTDVADRMYVVSADGGSCITDAVMESRNIIEAASRLRGENSGQPQERYAFEFPGSVQGFMMKSGPSDSITNASSYGLQSGLAVNIDGCADFFVSTFLEKDEKQNRETVACPTLYQTQKIKYSCMAYRGDIVVTPYVDYVGTDDLIRSIEGPSVVVHGENEEHQWVVPEVGGMPICRFGFKAEGHGLLVISKTDWNNTPAYIGFHGILMRDMWDSNPFWAKSFVSSAKFSPNLNHTFCITHDEDNGLATIGTSDFTDYSVTATVTISLHENAGLVARSCGHRRYYAAILGGEDVFSIIMRKDRDVKVLASAKVDYRMYESSPMSIKVQRNRISASFSGIELEAEDDTYRNGAAGFVVSVGTMFIDDFCIEAVR